MKFKCPDCGGDDHYQGKDGTFYCSDGKCLWEGRFEDWSGFTDSRLGSWFIEAGTKIKIRGVPYILKDAIEVLGATDPLEIPEIGESSCEVGAKMADFLSELFPEQDECQ